MVSKLCSKKIVIIANTTELKIVPKIVTQGSVLSSSLFIICINDLLSLSFRRKLIAFADYIALRFDRTDWEYIWDGLNIDFRDLRN